MYASGTVDAQKAIHCKRDGIGAKEYWVDSAYNNCHVQGMDKINLDDWRKLMNGVTEHISKGNPNIFVNDAAIGSSDNEVLVRVISPDANASLYLKHMLQPSGIGLEKFTADLVVYYVPNFKLTKPASCGLSTGSYAVYSHSTGAAALDSLESNQLRRIGDQDKAAILEKLCGVLILGGTSSLSNLRACLLNSSNFFQLRKTQEGLPVNGSVLLKDGNTCLIFSPPGFLNAGRLHPHLIADGHCFWSKSGVYPTLGGVSHGDLQQPRSRSDLVVMEGPKETVVQSLPQSSPIVAPSPKSVIFLLPYSKPYQAVTDVSAAMKIFTTGFAGIPYFGHSKALVLNQENILEQRFCELLQDSKSTVHVINSNGKKADVDAMIYRILEGTI
eukprot:TRINITY_DN3940_c0_g1_i10.p1 TRINITY_DN3940_c0_g1~~TRINITY_DN3940_c0_g1_i10.p1  ORF type:complete len:386 (-),score=66.98 TRINITY_DN3940_c0_g1_i10:135-1292(-)